MKEEGQFTELYKLYVQLTDKLSERRLSTNRFFISLLSLLLGIPLFVPDRSVLGSDSLSFAFAVFGVLLCIVWLINIRSYRQLNSGKFKVIHQMEQHLAFRCFDVEWQILEEGKNQKQYLQLSRVEQFVPVLLSLPFLLQLAVTTWQWFT